MGCGRFEAKEALAFWVQDKLGVKVPGKPICAAHQAPLDYLWRAYDEPGEDLVVWAPRGGGKTRLAAVATLLDLMHKDGCQVRILGGSLDQSLRMWEHLCPDLERAREEGFEIIEKARRIGLDNGSAAAILPQSQRAVRGLRVQKLRCDEVELFDRRVWEAAQLVTRSTGRAAGVIEAISTWHEPNGLMKEVIERAHEKKNPVFRWCLLEVLEHCPDERVCETCPLLEDCRKRAKTDCDGFFSIEDAIKMKGRVSKETWESEMMCLRPSTHGAVFPYFEEAVHVSEHAPMNQQQLWLGVDFGYENPFVALWVWSDAAGRAFVVDEYVQTQKAMHEHIAEIRSRCRGEIAAIGCDPAGNGPNHQTAVSDVKVLKRANWNVFTSSSQIQQGLEMIRAALRPGHGEARLWIHPRCKQLIKAMRSYRNKPGTEIPIKDGEHDHLIDALRYFYINRSKNGPAECRMY